MDEDRIKVEEALDGDTKALISIRTEHDRFLHSLLLSKGANATEAEDLLADLWGDCVGSNDDRPSILTKYSGRRPLRNWLATVAIHRLFDRMRRQKTHSLAYGTSADGPAATETTESDGQGLRLQDDALIGILRQCLEEAFAACSAHLLLMLRLVYVHDLSQREVGRMWGWHESRISRALSRTMRGIEEHTVQGLKQNDPWIELAWEDFLELCETHQVGFL